MEETGVNDTSLLECTLKSSDSAEENKLESMSNDVISTPIDTSELLTTESPMCPEEDITNSEVKQEMETVTEDAELKGDQSSIVKRKLSEEISDTNPKVPKLDAIEKENIESTQSVDDEVSEITALDEKPEIDVPTISRLLSQDPSSPRKISIRSNSVEINMPKCKSPKSRSHSVDFTKQSNTSSDTIITPSKTKLTFKEMQSPDSMQIDIDLCSSRPAIEVSSEICSVKEPIVEKKSDLDSKDIHSVISPSDGEVLQDKTDVKNPICKSDPVLVEDKKEIFNPATDEPTISEECNNSELNKNLSEIQPKDNNTGKTTDLDTTDNVCSVSLDSPDHVPSMASKLISKLSNGNSSTPTEITNVKHNTEDSNVTPDFIKINDRKGKKDKNESYRVSNTTTPSTISPLQNGHSLPVNTPQIPIFNVHVNHNEDCEFLSLYVVRTDNDLGMDMCKEYQRISKRFTIDPYLADVSVNTSPSSVTSLGMMNLPNKISFASTLTSTSTSTSSNRTSDGAFVVPQPPRKSILNPSTSVEGYDALLKKLQDIFSHLREAYIDESNRSLGEEKVSIGVQTFSSETLMSNGTASPEEVSKCDKITPKSSLRKTRVRGRRHVPSRTKRAILPTQAEEPEYMHGMNSPEMLPATEDNGKISPVKTSKDKPLSSLVGTPKSVSKLKQKRLPTSPRPATPVEKVVTKPEYPGFAPDTVVLAKWVDRRYYSGKVLEITEPNKYLIKFDDGQSKILLDDFIIFGDMKKLPLQGHSVYALVDEEQNYEPGLVLEIDDNENGTVTYKCTTDGDTMVMVTASELYLTEDQARSLKESSRARSPTALTSPRRRHNRELDLDNIIQGPRIARSRDKGNSSTRKRVTSPKSPKASTSGVKTKNTPVVGRKRLASESSEMSESSNSAPPTRLEEVAGVEPEVQRTPRKIDGVKAGPLQLKGAAKQNIGKKNSKLTKFETDEDTCTTVGPIPTGSKLFEGFHFLLTCTEPPQHGNLQKVQESRHYSSEEDSEATSGMVGTDTEDLVFCARPFNKERLKEQLEAGGGIVYSHFDDVPKSKYPVCKLIAPRPCLTAKYIQCLAADIRAISHGWVIMSCIKNYQLDMDAFVLPAGWSIIKDSFINWVPSSGHRNSTFFKDKIILLCGEQDTFVKFWKRVATLAGATTRVVNEEDLNMSGALALVTDWDCPHEVQNKANQDNIPLVSTTWVVQCLIEAKVLAPNSHDKFSFMYTEPE